MAQEQDLPPLLYLAKTEKDTKHNITFGTNHGCNQDDYAVSVKQMCVL